ncbi:unnamed protein product, partial [Polarella glacialis]
VSAFIAVADKDGDGYLNFSEFVALVKHDESHVKASREDLIVSSSKRCRVAKASALIGGRAFRTVYDDQGGGSSCGGSSVIGSSVSDCSSEAGIRSVSFGEDFYSEIYLNDSEDSDSDDAKSVKSVYGPVLEGITFP